MVNNDSMKIANVIDAVQSRMVVDVRTYEVPYNHNIDFYKNAGSNNPSAGPLSQLVSCEFTGRFNENSPIFKLTYRLSPDEHYNINGFGDDRVCQGFWIKPSYPNQAFIDATVEIKDDDCYVTIEGMSNCDASGECYCYFDEEYNESKISNLLDEDTYYDLQDEHECGNGYLFIGTFHLFKSNDASKLIEFNSKDDTGRLIGLSSAGDKITVDHSEFARNVGFSENEAKHLSINGENYILTMYVSED